MAKEIIIRYNLESYVGFHLIHKHSSIESGKIMLEEVQNIKNISSLVLSAQSWNAAARRGALPTSWAITDNKLCVVEASLDPAILTGIQLLKNNPQFVEEITETIVEYNLQKSISLAILKRKSLVANKNQMYIEYNPSNESRSIIQLWNKNNKFPNNAIPSSWVASGPIGQKKIKIWAACVEDPDLCKPKRMM